MDDDEQGNWKYQESEATAYSRGEASASRLSPYILSVSKPTEPTRPLSDQARISILFRRGTQLQWTSYISKCCDSLSEAHEYETDLLLVALVRMQRVTDRVFNIMPSHSIDFQDPTPAVFRAPFDMAINGVRREMEAFANIQPDLVKQNSKLDAFLSPSHSLTIPLRVLLVLLSCFYDATLRACHCHESSLTGRRGDTPIRAFPTR